MHGVRTRSTSAKVSFIRSITAAHSLANRSQSQSRNESGPLMVVLTFYNDFRSPPHSQSQTVRRCSDIKGLPSGPSSPRSPPPIPTLAPLPSYLLTENPNARRRCGSLLRSPLELNWLLQSRADLRQRRRRETAQFRQFEQAPAVGHQRILRREMLHVQLARRFESPDRIWR
ncbi:hypothetical protein B0H11DRAFT_549367 [Mycena galericulata]|nr:hypothetical protein B0H11DRAFT_549367 [Mycena galericulata]